MFRTRTQRQEQVTILPLAPHPRWGLGKAISFTPSPPPPTSHPQLLSVGEGEKASVTPTVKGSRKGEESAYPSVGFEQEPWQMSPSAPLLGHWLHHPIIGSLVATPSCRPPAPGTPRSLSPSLHPGLLLSAPPLLVCEAGRGKA